ncbi:MAG: thioredoxin family protein [Pseudomonadota bacterium]
MLKQTLIATAIVGATLGSYALIAPSQAAVQTGAEARGFMLTNADGERVSLRDYRGKTVVLEWHNPGCPFVQKHYNSGNMQKTQAAAKADGVVWLTINSGAAGKQGDLTAAEAKAMIADQDFNASHYLFDRDGRVGKAYGAKTTPHMYIIDSSGKLVYQGGIDDKPTANQADIAGARNHVTEALKEIKAGKAVSVASSRPYGCSVKYAS